MISYPFAGKKLMTPGPVPLPPEVQRTYMDYECHHRSQAFGEVLDRVFKHLKKVFQTQQHCFVLSSTGTGGLEAALVNTMVTDRPALFINAGQFGERWGKIATAYGIPFEEIKVEWGQEVDLDGVRDRLRQGKFQALAFQACETSTGVLQPVEALAQICREERVLSVVDGITALGATPLPMDQWGLDVVVGGSQKSFMLPTGAAFISLSPRAEEVKSSIPSYYFDLKAEKKANLQGKTRYSTPTHLVIALDQVLDSILHKIGFEEHLLNMARKAQFFRDQVPLPVFSKNPCPSLTCLSVPEGLTATGIQAQVWEQGWMIATGQGPLKEKILRVGHMGDISKEELLQTAKAIGNCLG